MDEDSNLKQRLLKSSSRSKHPSATDGAAGNDVETDKFDTFETIAYSRPSTFSGPGSRAGTAPPDRTGSGSVRFGSVSAAGSSISLLGQGMSANYNASRFGRSATDTPTRVRSPLREDFSADETTMVYKQKYARMDMRQVSFMTRFRRTAQQMNRQPSARPSADSTTIVKIESGQSEDLSPMKNAASCPYAPSVMSDISQSQQMLHGAMGAAFVDVRKKATALKQMDKRGGCFALARLGFEILFTTTAVVAAVAVAVHDAHSKDVAKLWEVPWLSWLILAALLCPTIRLGDRAVDLAVKGLEAVATRLQLENVHYTLIGLSSALKLVASTLLLETLVLFIMHEHDEANHKNDRTINGIKRTSLCFVVFAFVDLAKTLGCRLLSLRVNAESLFDLLKTTIEKEHVLTRLMTRARIATTRGSGVLTGGVTEEERIQAIARLRDIPEWSVDQYLDNLYEMSLPVDEDMVASFTDRITDLVTQFRTMPEAQLDEHATCAAEFCWLTVAPAANISSERMYREDLAVLLQNEADTEFAFSLFDLDGDGYVTEPEVHSRIQVMYRERRNLARTLQDNDNVIYTLEMIIGACMHVFAIIPYLIIFKQHIAQLLFSISSVSVASAFVFGNSLKTLYESVVFLFVIRPYQVGDAISYKDGLHVVKNFGLLSTKVQRWDGCTIWVPNQTLMTADIINVTRSHNLTDRLTFQVDVVSMNPELCENLACRVADMVEREDPRRLFNTSFTPSSYIIGVCDPLKYKVGLTYQLAFNGEKFAHVVEARTLVNYVIGQWLIDHKLSHSTSVQPLYSYEPSVVSAGNQKTA